MLVQLEDREVSLRKLEISASADDGKVEAKLSFSADLTQEDIDSMPDLGKGVALLRAALADEAARQADKQEDGPNSVSITIRRDFEGEKYKIGSAVFLAEVSGSPRLGMVDGGVTLFWRVSSVLESKVVTQLAKTVSTKSSVCRLSVSPVQGSLTLVDDEPAQASV